MKRFLVLFLSVYAVAACGERPEAPASSVSSLSEVPAVRLNYRYEADVPAPDPVGEPDRNERNPAVQADFDSHRTQEILHRTITSPDGSRVVAVYHRPGDLADEFRLDMYTPVGGLLQKITADTMAVHFPDTIRWAPDSSGIAFVAMVRGATTDVMASEPVEDPESTAATASPTAPAASPTPPEETNTNANVSAPADPSAPARAPTPAAPTGILTFRTEQIYLCDADGGNTRPITQNEGLIYFYFVWSPDSKMLAALAAKSIEWRLLNDRANLAGEMFVPVGRPRIVEKNGRERRLDDALTAVQPVWSPDSRKVACAFEHQVRIYDGDAISPTQAAIPLRNPLRLSSEKYDREQAAQLGADNTQPAPATDETATYVSFNPIVALQWTAPELLYFQTAFIKRMKNESDSVTSFQRWHRLVLSPQPVSR